MVLVFLLYGAAVGHLFSRLETLHAYSSDLLGSLLGVILFAVATSLNAPPPVWFAMGMAPLLYLSPRLLTAGCALGVIVATWSSVGGAYYSPYNRIDLRELGQGRFRLQVNRDFHQYMHDLSAEAIGAEPDSRERQMLTRLRDNYDIPFVLNDERQRALIVGAGTGNDVQAALRHGYKTIVSVDIDGTIIEIGRQLHPERPYSHPAVTSVVNDARAFFEQYEGPPFDVVCYGLLDSHAMFSAMSSLRLENYVYTEEGLRSAWQLVSPDGHLSVSFSVYAGDWIADRMYWTLAKATGRLPVMIHHGMHHGRAFIVSKRPESLRLERVTAFPRVRPTAERGEVTTVSDDWPFLFIRPGRFPWGYVVLLSALLLSASLAIRRVFGGTLGRGSFDAPLFLMGAAFLLLETRGVTTLSLLFGSTWVVNAAVFGGILATALLANLAVQHFRPLNERVWFVPLTLSLLLLGWVDVGDLNQWSLVARGVLGGLLIGLPVGLAGVIVSIRLSKSTDPTASLGSNLLGAVVGGCLEYLSMWTGLRALVGFALAIYLLALAFITWRPAKASAPTPNHCARPT